ncbi:hypothetical protein RRG08_057074 [Elysia crispata]|uniref:Uncharacterized protein n=1 Tax=Elysia crispata TaxID=231223 RepID=A0AAE1E272_9GAST|nr:hypothetical protein RRG08_057074 [Elysia crispata]
MEINKTLDDQSKSVNHLDRFIDQSCERTNIQGDRKKFSSRSTGGSGVKSSAIASDLPGPGRAKHLLNFSAGTHPDDLPRQPGASTGAEHSSSS